MARLSTHVLDTMHGTPAAGVRIDLIRIGDDFRHLVTSDRTNGDGRTSQPLLQGDAILTGRYELVFSVGEYFRARGIVLPEPAFLDDVHLAFGIADASGNYHVPLLISPYGYTTYRGS